jgi:hypothetical protein
MTESETVKLKCLELATCLSSTMVGPVDVNVLLAAQDYYAWVSTPDTAGQAQMLKAQIELMTARKAAEQYKSGS